MDLEVDIDNMDMIFGDGTDENAPQDIVAPSTVFDFAFHPTSPYLALGIINGSVAVHQYRTDETTEFAEYRLHDSGITGMEFTENGSHLVTVSSDRSINVFDCNTQQTVINIPKSKKNPHKFGLSAVNICSESLLATGDDDGIVALWDMRANEVSCKYHEHADYISQMLFFNDVDHLVTASGDTTLGAFDMRNQRILSFSDVRKDELTCMAFIPATDNIVCGTPSGTLPVWKYGSWSRPFDMYEYHPKEVDTMAVYNDNIIFTGACDGLVRVMQMHPVKRILTHLGGNLRRQPISKIRISGDRQFLGVTGQDGHVQFIDISWMEKEEEINKLLDRAAQRHQETLANATKEAEAERRAMEEGEESDSDWTSDSDEEGENSDDSDAESTEDRPQMTDRQKKRERVAAAKWLKEEKKKKVNFGAERRKRRIRGFWGDL